jgi:tetratricopeptide (TPR) repeat protein
VSKSLRLGIALAACLGAGLALSVRAEGGDPALAPINTALQAGQADKALALLAQLPSGGRNNAAALNLACRVRFTLGDWEAAVRNCETAVRLEPGNSIFHMWLGRALGEKASRAFFTTAYSLGKRVLAEFQKAAELDPRNAEGLFDLGSFYVEAPSVAGGGLSKAESVAQELDRVDPPRAWELRARIAADRKDQAAAEANLKQAISLSRHPASQWSTLARFYGDRKRWSEMDAAIGSCMAAAARDPRSGAALYDAAGVLIAAGREPALAARMLEDYVNGSAKTEEAPTFIALSRLARLKEQMGDHAGAQTAVAAALQLAQEYQPARDLRR